MTPSTQSHQTLAHPPIVEAILDIDCEMPAEFNLADVEGPALERFKEYYPNLQRQHLGLQLTIDQNPAPSQQATQPFLQALRFLNEGKNQLVQIRTNGFTFNRLAPYTALEDYEKEIERTWNLFRGLASPVKVTQIRLRYVNRILIPVVEGKVKKIEDYFNDSPLLQFDFKEGQLQMIGFFNQRALLDATTGHQANIVLMLQPPVDQQLPFILDITVITAETDDLDNWAAIWSKIDSLRQLKNYVFYQSLTEKCLTLFE